MRVGLPLVSIALVTGLSAEACSSTNLGEASQNSIKQVTIPGSFQDIQKKLANVCDLQASTKSKDREAILNALVESGIEASSIVNDLNSSTTEENISVKVAGGIELFFNKEGRKTLPEIEALPETERANYLKEIAESPFTETDSDELLLLFTQFSEIGVLPQGEKLSQECGMTIEYEQRMNTDGLPQAYYPFGQEVGIEPPTAKNFAKNLNAHAYARAA